MDQEGSSADNLGRSFDGLNKRMESNSNFVAKTIENIKKLDTETTDYSNTIDKLTEANLRHEVAVQKVQQAEERLAKAMGDGEGNYERIERAEMALDQANKNLIASNRELINASDQVGNVQRSQVKTLSDLEKAQNKLNLASEKYNKALRESGPNHPTVIAAQTALSDAAKRYDKLTTIKEKDPIVSDTIRIRNALKDINKEENAGVKNTKEAKSAFANLVSQIGRGEKAVKSFADNWITRNFPKAGFEKALIDSNNAIDKLMNHLSMGIASTTFGPLLGLRKLKEGFTDFAKGVEFRSQEADKGLNRLSDDLLKLGSGGFRGGYNLEQSISNMFSGAFDLSRWERLSTVVIGLIALITELAGAITALASAAAMAAAAVGGAFLAALAQLVPVVALLYGAFHGITSAIAAATLQQKASTKTTQAATQAAGAHKAAVQQVQIAEQNLAKARLDAARNLVDSRNKVIDSVLAERSANLSLISAKEQLRRLDFQIAQGNQGIRDRQAVVAQAQRAVDLARQQGNSGNLLAALQGLGTAQQQLQSYQYAQGPNGADLNLQRQQAQLSVDEAVQQRKESILNLNRAIKDNNTVQKQGINQNPSVVSAIHALTTAQNSLATSTNKLAGNTSAVQAAFAQLTPVERQFAKFWASTFGPNGPIDKIYTGFTDRIIMGVEKALKQIIKLFQDPVLKKAFGELADAMSNAFVNIAKFFTSPQQRKFIEFFTTEAAKNFPIWITFIERLITLFERIAQAAAPALTEMIKGFTGDVTAFTNNISSRPQGGTSATRTFSANAQQAANRSGVRSQSGGLTDFFNNAEEYAKVLGQVFGAFGRLMGAIISAAAPAGMNAFKSLVATFNAWTNWVRGHKDEIRTFTQQSVKTLGNLLVAIGKLLSVFTSLATKNPQVFQNLIKFLEALSVPALSITAGALAPMFNVLAKLFATPGLGTVLGQLIGFLLAMKIVLGLVGAIPILGGFLKNLLTKGVMRLVTIVTDSIIAKSINGGNSNNEKGLFQKLWNKLKGPAEGAGGTAAGAVTGAGAAAVVAIPLFVGGAGGKNYTFGDRSSTRKYDSLFPKLAAALREPKFANQAPVLLFQTALDYIKSHRGSLSGIQAGDWGQALKQNPGLGPFLEKYLGMKGYEDGGQIPPHGGKGKPVPIMAHTGEWVLNALQQEKIAKAIGRPIAWVREFLFGGKASLATAASRAKSLSTSASLIRKAVGNYLGPQIEDWAGTAYADPMDGTPPGAVYSPVFMATPGGEYVQVSRADAAKAEHRRGFWIPDYVKRAAGWTAATKNQINSWKTNNIISGLRLPPFGQELRNNYLIKQALQSPLWNYDQGGMVGWTPPSLPTFASGGIVTPNVSAPSTRSIGRGVNQKFDIHTTSPVVDVDYVMRIARIHAEAGY